MKRVIRYSAAAVVIAVVIGSLALFIANRPTTEVLVVDESGMPIAHAEIAPQSLSINYAGRTTDRDGAVRLPLVPQTIHWISVRKRGYQDYRSGDIEHMKRVIVILKKVPNQAGAGNGAMTLTDDGGRLDRAVPDQRR